MAHIAFWLYHASRSPRQLHRLAELLCEPVLHALERTAMIDRDKRIGRKRKTIQVLEAQLTAEKSQGVDLDSLGFFVFDDDESGSPYPAPHWGYIAVPYESERLEEYLRVFKQLFMELNGVLGYISVEPCESEAQSVCLGQDNRVTRARTDISDQRRRERKAQSFYEREHAVRLPAVHWAIFLSTGHLKTIDKLEEAQCFHHVENLGDGLAYVQLTDDPMDTLGAEYDRLLDAARWVLAPLLIDVSDIELTPKEPAL